MLEIRHERMGTSKNIREAYEQIYSKEGIKHKDSFYSWIIGLLKPEKLLEGMI